MRIATSLLLSLTYVTFAQVPAEDSRNVTVVTLDTHFAPPVFKSRTEWETRAAHLRKQIQFAASLLRDARKSAPPRRRFSDALERKGCTRLRKVLLETMPGFYLGGNLYRPMGRNGPFPAVVSPHGHWAYGKAGKYQSRLKSPAAVSTLRVRSFVVFPTTWSATTTPCRCRTSLPENASSCGDSACWACSFGTRSAPSIFSKPFPTSTARTHRRNRRIGRRDANSYVAGDRRPHQVFVAGEHDFVHLSGRLAVRKCASFARRDE